MLRIASAVATLAILALWATPGPAGAEVSVSYAKPKAAGAAGCRAKYPRTSRKEAAFWSATTFACWSCPRGYKRWVVFPLKSGKACRRKSPRDWAHANRRGKPGCPGRAFRAHGKCWTCPDAYVRSPKFSVKSPGTDRKGCVRISLDVDGKGFVASKTDEVRRLMDRNAAMIRKAAGVVNEMARLKKASDIGKGDAGAVGSVARRAGYADFHEAAVEDGAKSTNIGGVLDASLVYGRSAGWGHVTEEQPTGSIEKPYESKSWSVGITMGIDAAYELGYWKVGFDGFEGEARGVVVGGALGLGVSVTWWWAKDGGEYVGWSLSGPQLGVSAELEYTEGETTVKD